VRVVFIDLSIGSGHIGHDFHIQGDPSGRQHLLPCMEHPIHFRPYTICRSPDVSPGLCGLLATNEFVGESHTTYGE
jgi:hypothetical protein